MVDTDHSVRRSFCPALIAFKLVNLPCPLAVRARRAEYHILTEARTWQLLPSQFQQSTASLHRYTTSGVGSQTDQTAVGAGQPAFRAAMDQVSPLLFEPTRGPHHLIRCPHAFRLHKAFGVSKHDWNGTPAARCWEKAENYAHACHLLHYRTWSAGSRWPSKRRPEVEYDRHLLETVQPAFDKLEGEHLPRLLRPEDVAGQQRH